MTPLNDQHFQFFAGFLKKSSGYNLLPEKKYLLETRLEPVMKIYGISQVDDIVNQISANKSDSLTQDVIDAMTVNETYFFRDAVVFDVFEKTVLPDFLARHQAVKLRIWSAACSTGQEPYSIAMILENYAHTHPAFQYEIVASDINRKVLSYAEQGVYTDMEVERGLPEKYKLKYFSKEGTGWKISDILRQKISFKRYNLQDSLDPYGHFHFILLRNVLIYFDHAAKRKILLKLSDKLAPSGHILLGAAECVYDDDIPLYSCPDARGLYVRR